MHECLSVKDWVRDLAAADEVDLRLALCPRCSRDDGDLVAWAEAVESCPDCPRHLEALAPGDERLSCPHCLATLRTLHRRLDSLEYFDPAVVSELAASEELFDELTTLDPREQRTLAGADERYHLWALCQRLISEAQALWHHDPQLATLRAETGAAIADRLDPFRYHPAWIADLRAKARGYLGNCYRILACYDDAEDEFARAHEHLEQGLGSGLWSARIRSLEASLRIDQGRYGEAEALLDRTEAFYRERADRLELARTQLKRCRIHDFRGRHREAAEECERALGNLDPEEHGALAVLAAQNRVYYLLQAGEAERARSLYGELPPTRETLSVVRRRWIEANLLRAEGKHAHAMQAFEEARKGFASADLSYDVALVSLDQAQAAFEMGDVGEMNRLVGAASLLLIEAGARREALFASQVLLSTIERGNVSPNMFTAIHRRVAALRPS